MVKRRKTIKFTDILKQVGKDFIKGIWYGMGTPTKGKK